MFTLNKVYDFVMSKLTEPNWLGLPNNEHALLSLVVL